MLLLQKRRELQARVHGQFARANSNLRLRFVSPLRFALCGTAMYVGRGPMALLLVAWSRLWFYFYCGIYVRAFASTGLFLNGIGNLHNNKTQKTPTRPHPTPTRTQTRIHIHTRTHPTWVICHLRSMVGAFCAFAAACTLAFLVPTSGLDIGIIMLA